MDIDLCTKKSKTDICILRTAYDAAHRDGIAGSAHVDFDRFPTETDREDNERLSVLASSSEFLPDNRAHFRHGQES